ncbi:hypothetical protein [Rhizobium sp. 2MFCol3.1]|uniref:hypothetical protein n=1 Tax=Rhizobium sp. 2MFCol3.1 TaxID=1246459 RepID=UPI001FD93A42|nr:hypothetical protein [Rhizobium sp. 2MFCol3.1]
MIGAEKYSVVSLALRKVLPGPLLAKERYISIFWEKRHGMLQIAEFPAADLGRPAKNDQN